MKILHRPVLLQEVIVSLAPKPGDTIVDGTAGSAGHSVEIAKLLGKNGRLILIDTDQVALERSKSRLERARLPLGSQAPKLDFVHDNFRNLDVILDRLGVQKINGLLLDLGFSSEEIEISGRGFSFQRDEPLLMTFADNPRSDDLTAEKIVNDWPEEELARIIYEYGEERNSRKIAKAIVEARRNSRITHTSKLVEIIERVVARRGKLHPATKTFQALRIVVNDEIEALEEALVAGWKHLATDGTIAVITFQGLESKVCKDFGKSLKQNGVVTLKKIAPTRQEVLSNPRSRSAHLRLIKKITNDEN